MKPDDTRSRPPDEPAATTFPVGSERAPSLEELADLPSVVEESAALAPTPSAAAPPALCTARVVELSGRRCSIAWRGAREPVPAEIAPEVSPELVALARARGDAVLVEVAEGTLPLVVGMVTTRLPDEIHLKAGKITVEGEREVVIRAGRAGLRLREDGDIEIVGSRISAASRGLFRLVGRVLRLN